ncbi:hypothetical protein BGZ99_009088 [Dissophora globulifera]|uniref:CENP-T/Histone H4 histone fold domain-containing protein n=1 Tax=Dissophora globulifera TaxID=979702 RepID=A0A9P6UNP4_9FUNG|nr:hypothetical protein BGZ99_009088 [Dissophora globulifera]
MDSASTPRGAPQPRTLGLRRPNYGPMQPRKKFPTTPHVTRRRKVVDESLLEALHQTHIGHRSSGSGSGNDSGSIVRSDGRGYAGELTDTSPERPVGIATMPSPFGTGANVDQVWASTEAAGMASMPQTPRRQSRTIMIAPGSGRRTPRRRSRSSNQHLRATPLKALADANQARVNRLISEANRRGRVGRDKHSPMGILRILSRLPGFNPPPQPAPDREPIPGSSKWRKLTPKSQRTNHIQMPDDPDYLIPTTTSGHTETHHQQQRRHYSSQYQYASKLNRGGIMSFDERIGYEKFKDQNPFLDLDEINRLWEDGRRGDAGRLSFGMDDEERRRYLDEEGGDTQEFNIVQGDLTNPFQDPNALEFGMAATERRISVNVGDITNTSQRGFEQGLEEEENDNEQRALERDGFAPGESTDFLSDPNAGENLGLDDINMDDGWEDIVEDENRPPPVMGSDEEQQTVERTSPEEEDDAMNEMDIESDPEYKNAAQLRKELLLEDDGFNLERDLNLDDALDLDEILDNEMSPDNLREAGNVENGDDERQPLSDQEQDAANRLLQGDDDLNRAVQAQESDDLTRIEEDRFAQDGDATGRSTGMEGQPGVQEEPQEYDEGDMNIHDEDHIEQQEYEEEHHDRSGVPYFDDFPSELGIMSNGNVLATSTVAPKKTVRLSAAGIPVPALPTSLQKQLVHTFSRSRISQEAMAVILEGTHLFFEQASSDLAAYAQHAGRRTIDETDVECLMQRLRITNEKVSIESLLQRYLPRELRDKVLYPDDLARKR